MYSSYTPVHRSRLEYGPGSGFPTPPDVRTESSGPRPHVAAQPNALFTYATLRALLSFLSLSHWTHRIDGRWQGEDAWSSTVLWRDTFDHSTRANVTTGTDRDALNEKSRFTWYCDESCDYGLLQSFTGPCNTPAHCNTGAIALATDMHLNFFDCNNVWYCPNIVCIQFWAITHLCAKVMKDFSIKFAVFSCFWNLLEHFWPHKYSTYIVHYTLVHYRYDNAYR